MNQGQFTLLGAPLPEEDVLFGVWDALPQPEAATGMAFAIGETPDPIWHVELPDEPEAAEAALAAREEALRRSQADLREAERRLARLEQEGVSFTAPTPLAAPEAQLLATMAALAAPVNFAAATEEEGIGADLQGWRAFLAHVEQIVTHYAWVETKAGEIMAGRTAVGWTGDFETYWATSITPQLIGRHQRVVTLVLGTRQSLLRLLIVISTGFARLAVRLVPGAQLLLIPAIAKFIRDVLAELRRAWPQFKALQSEST